MNKEKNAWYFCKFKLASLMFALLALGAKENGIAALPVAMSWNIIRLQSKQSR